MKNNEKTKKKRQKYTPKNNLKKFQKRYWQKKEVVLIYMSRRESEAQRTLKIEQQRQIFVYKKICANQENSLNK